MLKQGLRKLRLTKRFLNKPIRPLGTSTPYWASILSLHSHKSWRGQRGLFQFRRAIRHQFSASEQAKRSEKQLSKDINLKPEVCYYKVLNISTSADFDSIKVSYLNLAKKFHPDVAKDQEEAKLKFQQISEAYSILSKPELRFRYDQALGIKDPTWTVEKDFEDEFENQEVFMEYIKGERNYEDEKQFRDLSLEEEKSDELYDYYRYKYLGRFKEHEQNQGNLSPFRDMSNSSTVDVDSKYKMDKGVYDRFREMKKERADAGRYQIYGRGTDGAYYDDTEGHEKNQNYIISMIYKLRYLVITSAVVGFVFYQMQYNGGFGGSGGQNIKRDSSKRITKGEGIKRKILPI